MSMPIPVYATVAQLQAYISPSTIDEAKATRWLERASRIIDGLLIGALYDVDSNQVATDPDAQLAIQNATCAQVEFWNSGIGFEFGVPQFDTVRIGTLHLDKSGGAQGQPSLIAPQALQWLMQGGLNPVVATTYG